MINKSEKGIRINRFIAMCGVCSRRKADELIQKGLIKVNNSIVTTPGYTVSLKDRVCFRGKTILPEKKKYIILNKPRGYITTMRDERGRPTVMQLIENAAKERLVPVGRLDKETTGILLFTNDGLLAKKLTHPKHEIKKTYQAFLDKALKKSDFLKISKGLSLEDGPVHVDSIQYINNDRRKIKLEIHVGKNRIVRRLFSFMGYNVLELDRVGYQSLTKKNLSLGEWRFLTSEELKKITRDN